ncbi:MAG: hypothetical protein IPJ76_01180 [Flavobacteriales bacterium]|nr:MAG: hypothetical protein IPJ76_01180 [Flavobacteriales bacterium]
MSRVPAQHVPPGNWAIDYVWALLAMQEEAERDRPEDEGPDPEHLRKLASARTELLMRQKELLKSAAKQGAGRH